ncbi:MAG: YdeI/OmpD-associated family protein [Bacteroidota bacterium]
MDKSQAIEVRNLAAWREWLAAHHDREKNVWLIIYHKKSGVPTVYYDEAVDEAMCWGWVDSKINKRDGQSYFQYFARRNPKSNWSRVNKEKVARMEAEGRMQEAGRKLVRWAQANGTWTALDDVENLVIPPDLQAEFAARPPALEHWESFPRSVKRGILEWILNAKRPATRHKRILETAELAEYNLRANQYPRQKLPGK